jgi:GNAT superfamily N-acetyltransferase
VSRAELEAMEAPPGSESITLLDGRTAELRPIVPADAPRLVDFHERLSADTQYRRFFQVHPHLSPEEVERFTNVDYADRFAFVVVMADQIVAVARYDRLAGTDEAEVAFVVDDAHQHLGIGSALLGRLAQEALAHRIRAFRADTMAENRLMIEVFQHFGHPVSFSHDGSVVEVRIELDRDG